MKTGNSRSGKNQSFLYKSCGEILYFVCSELHYTGVKTDAEIHIRVFNIFIMYRLNVAQGNLGS